MRISIPTLTQESAYIRVFSGSLQWFMTCERPLSTARFLPFELRTHLWFSSNCLLFL